MALAVAIVIVLVACAVKWNKIYNYRTVFAIAASSSAITHWHVSKKSVEMVYATIDDNGIVAFCETKPLQPQ